MTAFLGVPRNPSMGKKTPSGSRVKLFLRTPPATVPPTLSRTAVESVLSQTSPPGPHENAFETRVCLRLLPVRRDHTRSRSRGEPVSDFIGPEQLELKNSGVRLMAGEISPDVRAARKHSKQRRARCEDLGRDREIHSSPTRLPAPLRSRYRRFPAPIA